MLIDEDYNPKEHTQEEREKIFESLIKIPTPFKIKSTRIDKKMRKRAAHTIIPFSELLNNLEHISKDVILDGNYSKTRLLKHPSLFNQFEYWSELLCGKRSVRDLMSYLGYEVSNRSYYNSNDTTNFIKSIITQEFVDDVLSNNKDGKLEFFKKVNSLGKKKEIDSMRSRLNRNNLSLANVVNDLHNNIAIEYDYPASKLLGFESMDLNDAKKYFDMMWYDKKSSISRNDVSKTIIGSKIVHLLRGGKREGELFHGDRGYSEEVSKLMSYRDCEPQDITATRGAYTSIGATMEYEYAFLMSIIKKFDPGMKKFSKLKKIFDAPILEVTEPSFKSEEMKVLNGEKEYFADSRMVSGFKSYMTEIKSSDYVVRDLFFKSLGKFAGVKQWADGQSIDKKVLLISKESMNKEKIAQYCRAYDWTLLNPEIYHESYARALELLFTKMPEFSQTSHLNTFENLNKIHDLINFNQQLIYTDGHRDMRLLLTQLMKKNFDMINGNIEVNGLHTYKKMYTVKLSDYIDVYKFDIAHKIPKNIAFFDAESLGAVNTGSSIFTLGICYSTGNDIIGELYVAPTIFDESELLINSQNRLKEFDRYITFNGKGFDIHLYEERLFVNRIRQEVDFSNHFDLLLMYARNKTNKKHLSKLKTLEKIWLTIDRRGDVSGRNIPELIREYHLGNSDYGRDIIAHNIPDVLTMPYIFLHSLGERFDKEATVMNFYTFEKLFK